MKHILTPKPLLIFGIGLAAYQDAFTNESNIEVAAFLAAIAITASALKYIFYQD